MNSSNLCSNVKMLYQNEISLQYGCPEGPRGKRKKQNFDEQFSESDLYCFLSVYDLRAGVEKRKSFFCFSIYLFPSVKNWWEKVDAFFKFVLLSALNGN